jgi:hypothetical protein
MARAVGAVAGAAVTTAVLIIVAGLLLVAVAVTEAEQ